MNGAALQQLVSGTRTRVAIGAVVAVVLVVTALFVLVDDPPSDQPRLRERITLDDETSSELTGAVVSVRRDDRRLLDIALMDRVLCTFELRSGRNYIATEGGDTWLVSVRNVDRESGEVDVRVDFEPDSGREPGCSTERRG